MRAVIVKNLWWIGFVWFVWLILNPVFSISPSSQTPPFKPVTPLNPNAVLSRLPVLPITQSHFQE